MEESRNKIKKIINDISIAPISERVKKEIKFKLYEELKKIPISLACDTILYEPTVIGIAKSFFTKIKKRYIRDNLLKENLWSGFDDDKYIDREIESNDLSYFNILKSKDGLYRRCNDGEYCLIDFNDSDYEYSYRYSFYKLKEKYFGRSLAISRLERICDEIDYRAKKENGKIYDKYMSLLPVPDDWMIKAICEKHLSSTRENTVLTKVIADTTKNAYIDKIIKHLHVTNPLYSVSSHKQPS